MVGLSNMGLSKPWSPPELPDHAPSPHPAAVAAPLWVDDPVMHQEAQDERQSSYDQDPKHKPHRHPCVVS